VFAAIRRFSDRLRAAGYDVTYIEAATFGDTFKTFFADNPGTTLVTMRSPSFGSGRRFRELIDDAGSTLRVVENELFCSTRAAFDEWAGDGETFGNERFYRWIRRESSVLMDGDEPVGGEWNYDDENREFTPEDWEAPPVFEPEHDAETEDVAAWVDAEFYTWGSTDEFPWPVTRAQACDQLEHFIEHRLPTFAPYQDAMRRDNWAMAHALLGSSINVGLLYPVAVIEAIEGAYHDRDDVSLASAEGCLRQLLG
jgi:deoxyribodipyrimidine photolyase-related protein